MGNMTNIIIILHISTNIMITAALDPDLIMAFQIDTDIDLAKILSHCMGNIINITIIIIITIICTQVICIILVNHTGIIHIHHIGLRVDICSQRKRTNSDSSTILHQTLA
jgi:hypothetical protein